MVSKLLEISGLQNEESRARSIVELEKEHPNLLVLVQSVESVLFQNGADTFEELKEALIAFFKQKEGRCLNRLPHYLVKDVGDETLEIDEEYEKALGEIFDFVHQVFFGKERQTLSKEKVNSYGEGIEEKDFTSESQAFMMLFYHFQKEHLKLADLEENGYTFLVKFVNNGCKDAFDRAYAHNLASDRVQQHQVHGRRVPERS